MDKIDVVMQFLQQHAADDRENFVLVNQKLDSLLESRAKFWGAWGSILSISAIVSGAMSFIFKPLVVWIMGPR